MQKFFGLIVVLSVLLSVVAQQQLLPWGAQCIIDSDCESNFCGPDGPEGPGISA